MNEWERVYAVHDWYDGPRSGVADYCGAPHIFKSIFNEANDDWSEYYALAAIDLELLKLVLEDWEIWLRWRAAFHAGTTKIDTHPALPEDRKRHDELKAAIGDRLSIPADTPTRARAVFHNLGPGTGDGTVKWLTS